MAQQMTLGAVRRRTLRLINFEDGLWDILLGSVFLMLSLYPVTRSLLGPGFNLLLFVGVLAILIVGQRYARRVFSAPRIGVLKSRRTPARTATLAISAVLVVATVGLVIATLLLPHAISGPRWGALPKWVGDMSVDIIFMLALIGFFSLMAYVLGIPRLYLYGWLVGVGNLASTALQLYAGYTFSLPLAIAAGVIVLVGVALFIRFLRKYQIPTAEA